MESRDSLSPARNWFSLFLLPLFLFGFFIGGKKDEYRKMKSDLMKSEGPSGRIVSKRPVIARSALNKGLSC